MALELEAAALDLADARVGSRAARAGGADAAVSAALTRACLRTDEAFLATSSRPQAGSTATTVLVAGRRLWCANVGDSRSVLGRAGGAALALSEDAKPSRPDEQARIKAAGGFVIHKRVMGELAVSRAFGDAEFKRGMRYIIGDDAEAAAAAGGGEDGADAARLDQPLIVAEPEIQTVRLEEDDEFVLLACDGMWDVLSSEEAVSAARQLLLAHRDSQVAAEALVDLAIQRGSRDNVSAVLVLLREFWPDEAAEKAARDGEDGGAEA